MWRSLGRVFFSCNAADWQVLDGPVNGDGWVYSSCVRTRVAQELGERRFRATSSRLQHAGGSECAQIGNLIRGRKQNIGIDPERTSDAKGPGCSTQVDFRGPRLRLGPSFR